MATLEDLEDLERTNNEDAADASKDKDGDASMTDAEQGIDPEILNANTQEITNRRRLLDNDLRVMRQEFQRLTHEKTSMNGKIKENLEKIENNRFGVRHRVA